MRSGVHEDDKRVIKSGRENRSERERGASEGQVRVMIDVEGGNRVMSIVAQKVSSLGGGERRIRIPGCMEEIE